MNAKHYKRKMVKKSGVAPGPGTYKVMEFALLSGGIRDATVALTMIASLLIFKDREKRWPRNVDEYCEWWGQSQATGYREMRAFKRCFPMYATPSELCVACKLRVPVWLAGGDDPAVVVAYLLDRKLTVAA